MTRSRRGRGEGSIYQRDDGFWVAMVSAGYDANGKRRRKVVYGGTKRDVQEKLRSLDPATIKAQSGKVTVAQWLTTWSELRKGKVADSTHWRDVKTAEKIKPLIGHLPLASVDVVIVERLYQRLAENGESADSVRRCGVLLGTAFKAAVKRSLMRFNPARDVDKPRVERREVEVATRDQIKTLLDTAKQDRLYALFVLACTAGLRQGELFALEWSGVDLDNAVLHVSQALMEVDGAVSVKEPKTKRSRRTVALPRVAVDALREHQKKMLAEGNIGAPVFCAPGGGWLHKANFYHRVWYPLLERAGLDVTFHSLRHAHATLLLASGTDAKTVSERLGHSTVAFTLDTYTKVTNDQQRAAATKMDALLG
jgi:integrase